eukprot:gene44915-40538_t
MRQRLLPDQGRTPHFGGKRKGKVLLREMVEDLTAQTDGLLKMALGVVVLALSRTRGRAVDDAELARVRQGAHLAARGGPAWLLEEEGDAVAVQWCGAPVTGKRARLVER